MILFAVSTVAAAGPWVRAPGTWYTKVAYSAFHSGRYVDPGAETVADPDDLPRFHGSATLFYGEVGLVKGLQIVGEVPFTWSHNRFPGSELRYGISGPGSARVGLGADVPLVKLPASLTVSARVPLFGGVDRLPFDPALGEDQIDVDVVTSVGGSASTGPVRWWTAFDAGLRQRTALVPARDPDLVGDGRALLYRAQLGWLPEFGWVQVEASGTAGPGRESHQLALGGAHRLTDALRLEAGASVIWRARAEAMGWGWNVGISHQRR